MALQMIGMIPCPLDSGHEAEVGVSREGQGHAVHIQCWPCTMNLQVRRSSPAAQRFIQQAQGTRAQGTQEKDSDRRETPWTERPSPADARPWGSPVS